MASLKKTSLLLVCGFSAALVGCQSPSQQAAEVAAASEAGSRLTVGTVQRDIRVGMSGDEVASILGSPNIVTTDERRRETWVYDRVSSDRVYSASGGGAGIPLIAGVSGNSGVARTSQRTIGPVASEHHEIGWHHLRHSSDRPWGHWLRPPGRKARSSAGAD